MTATATFTDPKTWAFQEGVESSELNTNIRDEINSMGPHLIARKTADQSVSASTVLQDDNTLILPVLANEVWRAEWHLRVVSTSAADFKFGWTFPAAGELDVNYSLVQGGAALNVVDGSATSPFGNWIPDIAGSGLAYLMLRTLYVGGANAGNVKIQWAQAAASGTTTVKAQSTVWAVRLA